MWGCLLVTRQLLLMMGKDMDEQPESPGACLGSPLASSAPLTATHLPAALVSWL